MTIECSACGHEVPQIRDGICWDCECAENDRALAAGYRGPLRRDEMSHEQHREFYRLLAA